MSKTTLDLVEIIWHFIKDNTPNAAVSGNVFQLKRPVNSSAEDIVINSLPLNNLDVQSAVVNVNIHVPNISVTKGGYTDNSMPNLARLKELSTSYINLLRNHWNDGYTFDVQQSTIIPDEDGKNHYINIRLDFYSINILN